jgi:hypothetical protein
MEGREDEIPDAKLPMDYRNHEPKPVFFGHYWLKGQPEITESNAACLSAGGGDDGSADTCCGMSAEASVTDFVTACRSCSA